jgi:hypothetical protein
MAAQVERIDVGTGVHLTEHGERVALPLTALAQESLSVACETGAIATEDLTFRLCAHCPLSSPI